MYNISFSKVLALVETYKFTPEDIAYLKTALPHAEDGYFEYLSSLNCANLKIYALKVRRVYPFCHINSTRVKTGRFSRVSENSGLESRRTVGFMSIIGDTAVEFMQLCKSYQYECYSVP